MKNRYLIFLTIIIPAGLFLTSCYKEFDPASYAPRFTINGFSAVDEIKPSNLVAYWAFQESLTDSVSGTNGSNSGTTFVNGFLGKAINLRSADKSYVTAGAPDALKAAQSFTVSFWVNPIFVDSNTDNGIDGILGLVGMSNLSNFWGNIEWFVENGSNTSATTLKVHIASGTLETWIVKTGLPGFFGVWSNHTLTYDAATSKFTYYINGSVAVPATSAAWTGPVTFANSGPMVFGCVQFQTTPSLTTGTGSQTWASYLTGTLDEVRIYNAALTPGEVNALVVLQGKSGK